MHLHIHPPEQSEYTDPVSGITIRRLTEHKANSHHFYFTNPGWWDNGKRLLFSSDRRNRTNLYSIELTTGVITQITDLERDAYLLHGCVNPQRDEAYFDDSESVYAVHLRTGELRKLWKKPEAFSTSMLNCTADGKHLCLGIYEMLPEFSHQSLWSGYVGFREIFRAKPLSRILRIPTDGGPAETVHENKVWIGHVNTSPTQPNLLTFCHEGPWTEVDNRIWGLDMDTGKSWQIRPREEAGEAVGHEYWHADGIHIGFHGAKPDGRKFFGKVRFDNTERFEVAFPHLTGHIHSNDFHRIVGDGGQVIRLWRWNEETQNFDGPRVLCRHRSSSHIQQAHPHPRFNAAGTEIVFTTNATGYCDVYLAVVPDFDRLPPVDK